jgi:hypothetical protein
LTPENGGDVVATPTRQTERIVHLRWGGALDSPNVHGLEGFRILDREDAETVIGLDEGRSFLRTRIQSIGGPVALQTQWSFRVSGGVDAEQWALALDPGTDARVEVDGTPCEREDATAFPHYARFLLGALAAGEHAVVVWRSYADAEDLMPPRLEGAFVANGADGEVRPQTEIPIGDWRCVGLPNHTRTVTYSAEFDRGILGPDEVPELRAPGLAGAAHLRVNGRDAGWRFSEHARWRLRELPESESNIQLTLTVYYAEAQKEVRNDAVATGLLAHPVLAILRSSGPGEESGRDEDDEETAPDGE